MRIAGAYRAPVRLPDIPQRYVVGVVFVAGMFVSILDTTIVTVALPTLGEEFGVGTSAIDWVVIGYLLSLATFIPASGWIGDRFGTKRTFLLALAVFTIASALCGVAQGLGQLIAFRMLQGAGGGMLTPVGTAMLFRAFPPAERAKASRVLLIPTVVAPALGPIVGGYLVDEVSWRWIFLVNLPIGIVAFAFGLLFLHEHREPRAGRFDVPGFVLAGGGLALLLYALGEGPSRGWGSPVVLVSGVLAIISLTALVFVELRTSAPMLQLRLLGNRLFRATNVAALFGYGSFIGFLFVMPLFLQEARGLSAFDSGLTTFPEALGVLVSSQIVGRIYGDVGPRRLMAGGLIAVALVMAWFTQVQLDTDLWTIRIAMFFAGASMAFVFVPLQAATFATISPADTGQASAIFSTQRQVAAALGVAILATAFAAFLPEGGADGAAQVTAFHRVYLVAAVMALVGALASLVIHDEDAAATMRVRRNAVLALD
jgi:EmrB/QacA subfamily drug resistance transporter